MEPQARELINYQDEHGREPFDEWITSLADMRARNKIDIRLARVELGNFGDFKSVGKGVLELRIKEGPGYRVYVSCDENFVVLLGGGDKSSQKRDIKDAQQRWEDYNA